MAAYNVDTVWDDPFEHLKDRRASQRFPARLKVKIVVTDLDRGGRLIGPGRVREMSLAGASVVTKHELEAGRRITVQFSTAGYEENLCLPETFTGTARVTRVLGIDGSKRTLAISFCEDFTSNMDFILFVDHLRTQSSRALHRQ